MAQQLVFVIFNACFSHVMHLALGGQLQWKLINTVILDRVKYSS